MADPVVLDSSIAQPTITKIRVLSLRATYETLDASDNHVGLRHIIRDADQLPASLLTTIENQAKADVAS